MTTPHQVGQVAKAEMIVAHVLDLAPADADHDRIAGVVVTSLLEAGWSAPRDMTVPALRPVTVATDAQRRAALAQVGPVVEAAKRKAKESAK
jgi:hypothetical protein